MPYPHKNIRLHPVNYIGLSWYFITLCCAGRRPVFANSEAAAWLIDNLREQSIAYRFAVHAYCVMPDHFHGLFSGLEPTSDLLAFLGNLKRITAHEFQRRHGHALWQRKFYDHILRHRDNPAGVAAYIWMNPVRKGLCKNSWDYPYSGSFVMDWKKAISPVESWVPNWKSKSKAPV